MRLRSTHCAIAALPLSFACATTDLAYEGELVVSDALRSPNTRRTFELRGELGSGDRTCAADVELDRTFEHDGFRSIVDAFVLTRGEACVLTFRDVDTSLFVRIEEPDGTFLDGALIPMFFARRVVDDNTAALVCKGGRGRVTVEGDEGSLALTLDCRSYVNGQEREETTVRIRGSFAVQTKSPGDGP